MLRKTLVSIIGGLTTALGVLFIVLPGPAWLLLPIGLAILSLEYPWAKKYLRISQRKLSQSAYWMDKKIRMMRN
ncbi:PGPGW domain-containing protein [Shewanella waksmanii]|uniref:PGPGW domain-containing protein n=1 Tax=Shewanella waksmanii TaxID=213783 RepID=UPI003735862E